MRTHLPIERKPIILQEYGRAFACINLVETGVNSILQSLAGFKNPDPELDEMTLGKKIRLAKDLLPKDLVSDLWKLNDNRLLLAHGITMVGDNDSIAISHKQTVKELSEGFLNETTNLAKALHERIIQENR